MASPDGGQPGNEVVDLHHFVQRMHLVERQRQLGIVGDHAVGHAGIGQVHLLQAQAEVEVVALRGQAARHGAGAHRHQDLAVGAELAQHVHVLRVADAAFDDADVARPAVLDVGQRRAIELDALEQREQPFVDVEQRHVATKAAGERRRRDLELAPGDVSHGCAPAGAAHRRAPAH